MKNIKDYSPFSKGKHGDNNPVHYKVFLKENYLTVSLNDGRVLPKQMDATLFSPVEGMPIVTVTCMVNGELKPAGALSINDNCLYYNDEALPGVTIIKHLKHSEKQAVDTVTFSVECELVDSIL